VITKAVPAVIALAVLGAATAQAAPADGKAWSASYQQAGAKGSITSDHGQFPVVKATGTLTSTAASGCYHVSMLTYMPISKPPRVKHTKSGNQCGKGSLPVSLSATTDAFFTDVSFEICTDDYDFVCGPATGVKPN